MSDELGDVLKRCAVTGAWYGQELTDVKSKNLVDDTPLHTMCSFGELESARILIEAGADVNAKGDFGYTPLFQAVIGENPKLIELLINSGADRTLRNDHNWTVLDYAQIFGSSETVLSILRK